MKNLTGTANWGTLDHPDHTHIVPDIKKDISNLIEEIYVGTNFRMSDIVTLKKRPNYGKGVIVKELENHNYWVVFPNKTHELSSYPWHFQVHNRDELLMFNS